MKVYIDDMVIEGTPTEIYTFLEMRNPPKLTFSTSFNADTITDISNQIYRTYTKS